ncbi:MAG: hypothetical protein HY795_03435 [Desulfovibrio sp.]|nr:hypothetical protein [Desulfovibrio sp.]MBI4959105.1 hypothetical protein [Desulfovibrio sp.]
MKTVDIAQAKIQPVLMILTHPFRGVKNLLITLRCLERYTDLRSFKKIYILANASFGEHLLLIQKYVKKYPGLIQDVHCSPPGHNPCVAHMQNLVHERHFKDVILKMDDDIFVTPGWLPPILEGFKKYQDDPQAGMVTPMVPINTMGVKILWDALGNLYGDEYKDIWVRGGHIGTNIQYHQFIWEKVLNDDLISKYLATVTEPYHVSTGPGSHLSINCCLYDYRVMDKAYPYNLEDEWFPDGEKKFDESIINRFVRDGHLKTIVARRSVVHHYSFNKVQVELMQSHPIEMVYEYLMRLESPGKTIRAAS